MRCSNCRARGESHPAWMHYTAVREDNWEPEDYADKDTIRAIGSGVCGTDAERAAARFIEREEAEDVEYPCLGGHTSRVSLVWEGNSEVFRVAVTGETVPQYTGRRIT